MLRSCVLIATLGYATGFHIPSPALVLRQRHDTGHGNRGSLVSIRMTSSSGIKPPGKNGGFLTGLRESISYIVDGDKFVKEYSEKYGPGLDSLTRLHPFLVEEHMSPP